MNDARTSQHGSELGTATTRALAPPPSEITPQQIDGERYVVEVVCPLFARVPLAKACQWSRIYGTQEEGRVALGEHINGAHDGELVTFLASFLANYRSLRLVEER